MAKRPHDPLNLDFSSEALSDLDAIWDWNAKQYGSEHANRYIDFLLRQTDRLRLHSLGRPVPTRPDFKYFLIRRRTKGHGHIVVYEALGTLIRVLRCFHTSQDWQSKMIEDA